MESNQRRSPLTAEQMQKKDEDEYLYLRRRHRYMESDTAAFVGGAHNRIVQQQRMIKSLQAVKTDIMTQVTVAKNQYNAQVDASIATNITKLLHEGGVLDNTIKKKRQHLSEIEREIKKQGREVGKLRLQQSAADVNALQRAAKTKRTIAILNQRLHVEAVKGNEIIAENKRLRDTIKSSLRERVEFNAAYQKIMRSLMQGKKVMMDLIEQSTLAYDQREEAEMLLDNLQGKKKRNIEMQKQLMEQMEIALNRQNALRDFLSIKSQKRLLLDAEKRDADKRSKDREVAENKTQAYRLMVEDIKTFSEEEDLDKLMASSKNREKTNFTVHKLAMDMNEQNEALQLEVGRVRREIDEQMALEAQRKREREETLLELKMQLEQRKIEGEDANWEEEVSKCQLKKLLAGVDKMCSKVNGDRTKIVQRLGGNLHPNEHNFIGYLEAIERRTVDIMEKVNYIELVTPEQTLPYTGKLMSSYNLSKFKAVAVETMVPTQLCAICVETEKLNHLGEGPLFPLDSLGVWEQLDRDMCVENFEDRMHNLSACRLPRSRKILQRRYIL